MQIFSLRRIVEIHTVNHVACWWNTSAQLPNLLTTMIFASTQPSVWFIDQHFFWFCDVLCPLSSFDFNLFLAMRHCMDLLLMCNSHNFSMGSWDPYNSGHDVGSHLNMYFEPFMRYSQQHKKYCARFYRCIHIIKRPAWLAISLLCCSKVCLRDCQLVVTTTTNMLWGCKSHFFSCTQAFQWSFDSMKFECGLLQVSKTSSPLLRGVHVCVTACE